MTIDKLPSCDFPAAHSMDTTWFAVDREGFIGVFQSGEAGAVPTVIAEKIGQLDDLSGAFEALASTGTPELQPGGIFHPGLRTGALPAIRKIPLNWPQDGEVRVLLFREEAAIPRDVRALPGVRVRHLEERGLFCLTLDSEESLPREDPRAQLWSRFLNDVYKTKTVVSARQLFDFEVSLARRGCFVYSAHDERFNMPEPYGLVFSPETPLRVRDLPKELADTLEKRVRFDVSFRATPYLQPAEHLPCSTWSSAIYLAQDGFTVRALPGREAEFDNDVGCFDLENEDPSWEPVVIDAPQGG